MTTSNTNKILSTIAAHRIEDLFDDFCIYIAKRYEANYDDAICDWNCVGATLSYRDDTHNIFIRLWERSEGHLNLPDMTMIVETVVFDRKLGTRPNHEFADRLRKEMNAFSKWLILTARICGFKYVADPNMPPIPDENVPGCTIACLPLK